MIINGYEIIKHTLLILAFSGFTVAATAQDWEPVTGSTLDFSGIFPGAPPLYQAGFSEMGFGASGGAQDKCAGVLNFQNNSHYLAVETVLSNAYEYRFSWNVRTIASGKQVQFQIGLVPGSPGTNIGSAQNIPLVSSFSQTVDDVQSAVFSNYDGLHYLIARRSGGGTAPSVRFDNFKLERRLISPPVLAFQQSNITIAEGGSTQVCVSVTTPSVASTADVVLSSDGAPHLIDFTTQTLTFPINSTTAQCFTLQLEPVNGIHDENHTYTLELQNLTGGATEGTPSSLTVTVTDDVPNPPEIEFQEPEITIAEGGSTSVCISVTTPSAGFTADVVLTSNADPHFTSFTTQTLTFPASSTSEQCFTLELEPANGITDQNHTYTFELQNLTGGATLGETTAITVTVEDDEELPAGCPWAGEDKTICEGETTTIGCPMTSGTEDYCYHWLPEEGLDSPHHHTTEAHPEETTTYTLYVTDSEGNLIQTETVIVTVLPQPETDDPDPVVLCPANSLALNAGANYTTYLWTAEETTQTITVSMPGEYAVTVSNATCSAIINFKVVSPLDAAGIKDYFTERGFFSVPITILPDPPGLISGGGRNTTSFCTSDDCSASSGVCVQDDAALTFSMQEDVVSDLGQLVQTHLDYFLSEFGYDQSVGIITGNAKICDCSDYLDRAENRFNSAELGYWIHLWDDPETDNDLFFIRGNVPSEQEHVPSSERSTFLSAALEVIASEDNSYDFNSMAERAIFAMQDLLLDNFVEGLTENNIIQSEGFTTPPGSSGFTSNPPIDYPCPTQTLLEQAKCISSSGIPVNIPQAVVLRFGINSTFADAIDSRALSGFTVFNVNSTNNLRPGYYNGRIRTKPLPYYFTGYYKIGLKGGFSSGEENVPYLFNPLIPTGQAAEVYLGNRTVSPEGNVTYTINKQAYSATIPTNTTGEGDLAADFEDTGDFTGENLGSIIYNTNLPPIPLQPFTNAEETARYNVYGNGEILIKVERSPGVYDWVLGVYETSDPNLISYYRWNCNVGLWQSYIPPTFAEERAQMSFLVALGHAALEFLRGDIDITIGSDVWHSALDIIGVIPIVGAVADVVNFVWYVAEGDFGNAALSFVGIIPIIGDLTVGFVSGKYVLRHLVNGSEVVIENIKGIGRIACAPGLRSEGDGWSTHLFIASLDMACLFPEIIGQFKRRYNPTGILDKALVVYGTDNEDKVEGLLKWLLEINDAGYKIGKAFAANPDLVKVWKRIEDETLLTFDAGAKERLFKWLANTDASVITAFTGTPNLIKGWKMLDEVYAAGNSGRKRDFALMIKLTQYSDNAVLLNRLVPNGTDAEKVAALKNIVKSNEAAPCKACGAANSGNIYLRDIDDYLDDIAHFANNCLIVDALKILKTARTATTNWQVAEIAQTIRLFRFNPVFINNIGSIHHYNVTGNQSFGIFDLRLVNDEPRVELKSYTRAFVEEGIPGSSGVLPFVQNPQIINQLTNYLSVSDDLSQLRYSFDARKLVKGLDGTGTMQTNPFNTIAEAEEWTESAICRCSS